MKSKGRERAGLDHIQHRNDNADCMQQMQLEWVDR